MTITPTAPVPVPAVAPAGGPDSGDSQPGDFLSLVQQALAGTPGGTPGAAAASSGAGPEGQDQPSADGATGPGDQAAALAANGLAVLPVPVAAVLPTPDASGTSASAGGPGDASAAAVGASTPSATPSASLSATQPAIQLLARASAGADTLATGAASSGAQAADEAGPGGDTAEAAVNVPVDAPAPTSATTSHSGNGSGSTDQGASQSAPPAPTVVAPVAVTTPTATTPGAGATTAPAGAPVTGQVFPEVTSLVSRGDGTHRITLTLKPEALGEVRVVMTVRDGAVHVRLAGGHEAHQALLAGSPELSRLLEQAGATETRIVVRDLSGAVAPTTGGSRTDQGFDLGQGLGAGTNRSQDEHAGTRAEQQATDGSHHTTTPGAASPRTVEPATRTRTSGVDVTM